MQITPLRRWYIPEGGGKGRAAVGDQTYLTNDGSLYIVRGKDGWLIRNNETKAYIYNLVADAGLFDAVFERRKDAVAALAVVLEEVE